jgi:hypothetical protein
MRVAPYGRLHPVLNALAPVLRCSGARSPTGPPDADSAGLFSRAIMSSRGCRGGTQTRFPGLIRSTAAVHVPSIHSPSVDARDKASPMGQRAERRGKKLQGGSKISAAETERKFWPQREKVTVQSTTCRQHQQAPERLKGGAGERKQRPVACRAQRRPTDQ